eukprot:11189201-Lingulodinium_polyedra.AAC.1
MAPCTGPVPWAARRFLERPASSAHWASPPTVATVFSSSSPMARSPSTASSPVHSFVVAVELLRHVGRRD